MKDPFSGILKSQSLHERPSCFTRWAKDTPGVRKMSTPEAGIKKREKTARDWIYGWTAEAKGVRMKRKGSRADRGSLPHPSGGGPGRPAGSWIKGPARRG